MNQADDFDLPDFLKAEVPAGNRQWIKFPPAGFTEAVHAEAPPPVAELVASPPWSAGVELASPPEALLTQTDLNSYLEAAALRYTYRLDRITPIPQAPGVVGPAGYADLHPVFRDQVFAYLSSRSKIVPDVKGRTRWMVNDLDRRTGLQLVMSRGMLAEAIVLARGDAQREAAWEEASPPYSPPASPPASPPEAGEQKSGDSALEETLWGILQGSFPPVASQSRRQLLLTERVVGWLNGLTTSVPPPDDVSQALARETLLQPFRHLSGAWKNGSFVSSFRGRTAELQRIYDYLNVTPPTSFLAGLRRGLRSLSEVGWQWVTKSSGGRPVLIHGAGGSGKSTLLAKLLLDHLTEKPPLERFPYVYLDFDLSALNPREPLTLLAESARQLALQFPQSGKEWNEERDHLLTLVRSGKVAPRERADALERFSRAVYDSKTGVLEGRQTGANIALSISNARDIRSADQFERGLPFLLVLDTFEEVQYLDRDQVKDVIRFLNELRKKIPPARVILMGRAPLEDLRVEFEQLESVAIEGDAFASGATSDFGAIEVHLGDLDPADARDYLASQGVSDSKFAADVVEAVGASPLSLRIIARVLQEGQIDIKALQEEMKPKSSLLSFSWKTDRTPPKTIVQGVLFRRLLGNIRDENVKKLAHPGLILRRITADLIRRVLAGPCGLGRIEEAAAQRYFEALAKEVSLVGTDSEVGNEPALRHRPELRRVMLRLMQADESSRDQIRQIHEGAVGYYESAAVQDLVARTEALYHRLMLGQPPRTDGPVDEVPTDEAVRAGYAASPAPGTDPRTVWNRLDRDAEELPLAGAAYISARCQTERLSDTQWEQAEWQDWELKVLSRTSYRARGRDSVESALASLEMQLQRMEAVSPTLRAAPLSPLDLIQVALNGRLQRYEQVESLATRRIQDLSLYPASPTNFKRQVEYRLLAAGAAFRRGAYDAGEDHITGAAAALSRLLDSPGEKVPAAQRAGRQFLRLSADIVLEWKSGPVAGAVAQFLTRLYQAGALDNCPILLRHAFASVHQESAPNEDLTPLYSVPGLPLKLFDRLPKAASSRLDEIPRILNLTPSSTLLDMLAQLDESGLADVVAPGSLAADPGSLFEEARRAGDLLPGEGPIVRAPQASPAAKRNLK